ncbi:hypothetical protein [Mariniradius sediminis]|uniref:Uncharacterized protein n=1 Tax=Mariniradius sediminis TaxID=2909237 RepID=A0ABS9C064_9BACT|nr:hypothetical protein [Mariniradius sediminis]MCF1753316.1 hypothetical protein [Mariniradius sediminis]
MKHFSDPKFWATVCGSAVPISMSLLWLVGIANCWSRSEIGTMIAAIAGPFAGLAGFLYIYATFIQQQELFERQSFESGLHRLLDHLKKEGTEVFPPNPKENETIRLKEFEEKYKQYASGIRQGTGNDKNEGEV